MTLTEFLTARLDEDEAFARKAVDERKADNAHFGQPDEPDWVFKDWPDHPGPGTLIVGGERMLAEVEAKRRIVEWADGLQKTVAEVIDDTEAWGVEIRRLGEAMRQVRALALVYVDHPDYREEWKP